MDGFAGIIALLLGALIGVLSGIMGIGGGTVLVPALVLLLGLEQHLAQGISLAAIVPASLVGALSHYRQRNVNVSLALALGLAAALSAFAGATIAGSLDAAILRRLFAAFLALISLRLLFLK